MNTKDFVILGLNISHDCSACLLVNGEVSVALSLERVTRVKRGTVPHYAFAQCVRQLITELLEHADIDISRVDRWIVTSTETASEQEERQLGQVLGLLIPQEKLLHLPHPGHHLSHASAAFYSSGFTDAAGLVVDSYGSRIGSGRERETIFKFCQNEAPVCLSKYRRNSSRIAGTIENGRFVIPKELSGIGELYRVVTLALGFSSGNDKYDEAGKTMGLASFGKRLSSDNLFINVVDGELNFDSAVETLKRLGYLEYAGPDWKLNPRCQSAELTQAHCDLASQIQGELEEACLFLVKKALHQANTKRICLSGGCFLNTVSNSKIREEVGAENLFVYPAATDDGNALGAALYAHNVLENRETYKQKKEQTRSILYGPSRLKANSIRSAIDSWGLECTEFDYEDLYTTAAQAIKSGEIIGWFQDRSEFGPRALGARSLLCHPGLVGMKDLMNEKVKFREKFRPFAASILEERVSDWFDIEASFDPFMMYTCKTRKDKLALISEITHVDRTCRLQTLAKGSTGGIRELVEAFERLTNIPLVLNTSFNLKGMPIVEYVENALDCFMGSRIDRLFIDRFEVKRPAFEQLIPVSTIQVEAVVQRAVVTESAGHLDNDLNERGHDITDSTLLGLCDGTRTVTAVAKCLDESTDKIVDQLLKLRLQGKVRWNAFPETKRFVFLPAQYSESDF